MNARNLKLSSPKRQSSLSSLELALAALESAVSQKGRDVRGLDIINVSDIADYFVIISGTSDRHVKGIADRIERDMADVGETPISVSGYETADWIVLDYGNLVVHVFYEPVRQYYEFDHLWQKGTSVRLPESLESEAKKFRTGMLAPLDAISS